MQLFSAAFSYILKAMLIHKLVATLVEAQAGEGETSLGAAWEGGSQGLKPVPAIVFKMYVRA